MKTFYVKKTCVGDGGELERSLDAVFGIEVMVHVQSCCEKRWMFLSTGLTSLRIRFLCGSVICGTIYLLV